MSLLKKILLMVAMLFPCIAEAQFFVNGDDPGRLRWQYIDTDNFRVIYPEGSDSLARVYGYQLEKYKIPVSRSTGYIAGQGDGKLMPAVLHTHNTANGNVAWAPKRMDMYTIPSAYDSEPMPWPVMLSVHEGRHVTQMQFGMTNAHKPFKYIFGEMWNILASLVYPGMYFIEGDAVCAETALTKSGRGRTADFLNYYRVAFDQGDWRKWERWLYGSQRYYTPDYYSLGYMYLAGFRYIYDYPEIMKEAYGNASRKVFDLSPVQTIVNDVSGRKWKDTFTEICDTMQGIWSRNAEMRAPFINMERVSKEPELYTEYSDAVMVGNHIYAIKKGFLNNPSLVTMDSEGNEIFICNFAHETSRLEYKDGKLYWTETTPDPRWSLKVDSRVRYMELWNNRKRNLTDKERLLFNPSFHGDSLAVVRYYNEGGSAICIREEDGKIKELHAPDSLQLMETGWADGQLYVTAISPDGYGVYSYDGRWKTIIEPQPVKIKDFHGSGKDFLMFTCDRTGVNELYHLYPATGTLIQKTSTRYGAEDFVYSKDGNYLYFSSQTLKGMEIFRTPSDSLITRQVDFADTHKYILADNLTRQENEIAEKYGYDQAVEDVAVDFSEPRKYRKSTHMFNIHSWTPVYVSVDNIMNMSFDYIYQAASLGVSGIMQNRLSTGVGEIGYSAHKDPYNRVKWRHSGHFKFTYSGLYPVIEAKLDFNDRGARQYASKAVISDDGVGFGLYSDELDIPYIEGKIKTYIPFEFSSGGWYKGVIPQLSYTISNDKFNQAITILENKNNGIGTFPFNPVFTGVTEGKNTFRHSLSASLRAYTILPTPNSAVYPKWGIGAEIGAAGGFESKNILSPSGYAYLYGYAPGFYRGQGMKLTMMHQHKLNQEAIFGQPLVQILPRGLASNPELTSWVAIRNSSMTKFTVDYAIPVYIGDTAIGGGFMYIKRLVLTPHFDYTKAGEMNFMSAGADLVLDLNGIIWIGWPVSMGVTYSYSGMADFNTVSMQSGIDMNRHHAGFIFNVSF